MYCKKCGFEVTDKSIKKCPKCGAKVNGLPTWAIVLIVVAVIFTVIPFALAVLGVIVAMTLPAAMSDSSNSRFRLSYLKTLSSINQSLLISQSVDDKEYTNSDELWTKGVKAHINGVDIPEGVRLSSGVEIKYQKLRESCSSDNSKVASESTACAILTIDVNGFDKAPNKKSTSTKISDRYNLLLYPISAEPAVGSEEEKILLRR